MIVDLYLQRYPFRGALEGFHEMDGQVGDWTPASLDDYCRQLSESSPQGDEHDDQLQRMTAANERFWYHELGWHTISPMVYLEAVDPALYLTRHYAPPDQRGRMASQLAAQVPGILNQARLNLTGPASAATLRQGAASAREYVPVYRSDLIRTFPAAEEPALAAAAALEGFASWLEQRIEGAPDHYPLGDKNFARMLEVGPGLQLNPVQIEELANREIDRNLERAHQIHTSPLPDIPPVSGLLAEARQILTGLAEFLHTRQIVTLPGEFPVTVRNSPPGARWSFASMDNPGLYETDRTAFYNITLPDADWPQTEQNDWMGQFDRPMLHLISLHEALPGHFVHALHLARCPSRPRKLLRNYAFTEGWAHYCEEMMLEVGYSLPELARLRSAQILAALERACRLLASVRLHCAGDSLETVARIFEQKGFMPPGRAHASARRGSFDPEYGYYTLGKMALMKLRADMQLPMRDFHDKILDMGAPPPALLRRSLGLDGGPL